MTKRNNFLARVKNTMQRQNIWLVFLLLFLMVPALAITIIKNHGPEMEDQSFNNLFSVAELRAYQVQNWLEEQNKVANVVSSNNVLMDYVQQLSKKPDDETVKNNILALFGALKEFYGYESIELVSPDRKLLLKLEDGDNNHLNNAGIAELLSKSIKNMRLVRSDILQDKDGTFDICAVVPLIHTIDGKSSVVALVALFSDLSHHLFSHIQKWPTVSATSESLLVRKEGSHIDYLSPLKFAGETLFSQQKFSVNDQNIVSAIALRSGVAGKTKGIDYRGKAVIAAYYPIKGTNWMVVSKVDVKEAHASLDDLVFWISVVSFIALLIIAVAFWVVLSKQRHLDNYRLLAQKTENERVLQQFYDLPFIGMAILSAEDLRWTRFNQRFKLMLGYSDEELTALSFFDLLPYGEVAHFKQRFEAVASHKLDGFTQETRFVGGNQDLVYVIASVQCTRRTNGDVQHFLLTVQDMTEIKQLGDRYLERQNHLNILINTIPDLIWLKDINGVYLSCNSRFESLYGVKENDIVGKTDYDFVDKEVADSFREHDNKAMQAGRSTENEEWLTLAEDGYRGLFSTVKTPVLDSRGRVIGVLGVARDITKRKEDELRLERLAKIHSALSQTNEAIIQCHTEQGLYDRVCEVIVNNGDMKMAWIGKLDNASGFVKPVARSGINSDYLQGLEISVKDEELKGPAAIAITTNMPYWCQDFEQDVNTAHWHERARKFGWKSSASIPLTQRSKVVSTLNIYSDVVNAFDEEMQNLLLEMGADISFALSSYVAEEERETIEHERQEALERLQKLAGRLPGVIYQYQLFKDGQSCFPFASDAIERIYHVKAEDVVKDASSVFKIIHPEDIEMVSLSIQESAENLSPWQLEYRVKFDDGEVRWLSGNAVPQKQDDDSILWHGFITDITERRKTEEQIEMASKVFEQSREGIMITDANQKLLMVNDAFSEITGYSREEVLGKTASVLSSGKHTNEFYEQMWRQIREEGHWQGEIWNKHKSGRFYPEWLSISQGKDKHGEVMQYIGVFTDMSKIKESEEHIHRLEHFDSLTNLVNRESLIKRLTKEIGLAEGTHKNIAVLFIDLDHFKNINDTLGHYVGDKLLMEVGRRISMLLQPDDQLGRQGGDEFIAVMPDADENEAAHMAEKILKSVASEMLLENLNLKITPSVGIAIYPQDGSDAGSLLKNADTAMYQAKNDGRNTYRFFTAEMQKHAAKTMSIESALRTALARNEFEMYYQPQVCAHTHEVVGAEALIRWNNPDLGKISPAEFIPVAEQSGQILEISNWVMETAIEQIKEWQEQGLPFVNIAVNLSAAQFRDEALPSQIIGLLNKHTVEPSCLTVELTETLAMSDPYSAVKIMDKLTAHGIKIAIDDFGTGYSSLSYLKKFKATKLKLDQSFVQDVAVDADDRSIIVGMISLAQSLGLKTIAEGVETQEQLSFLEEKGCDEIQGYYFSKPIPSKEFAQFISERKN
ncbi:EAL domain-containing protein [Hydrogenovibrio sp. JE_KL2]|uniref:bifunctional diguanylate cyclase/phosphodiesterase n=1 Tax=Hydrogenovibrio sp. JE_KL2 TaxID=2651188 RepID=UPI00128CC255|nr:EAL domain-containing protein [Hydrogenovibrio sp. JE_KL2]MPQ75950.1 EAL domain-containing protein [Hydrogenovibrio sp. JE_KL2]